MKKTLAWVALVLTLSCVFTSCDQVFKQGPMTEDQILDGKSVKAVYGESVSKYKNHKDNGIPYSVNMVLTALEGSQETSTVDLVYDGDSFRYTLTEAVGEDTATEEIVFHDNKMYYKGKDGGKHSYDAERGSAGGYVEESTVVKALEAAFPHDLPESWLDDLTFISDGDGGYKALIDIDESKSKEHKKYPDFFRSGSLLNIYFDDAGILERIELTGVQVNGEVSNVVISFSWQPDGNISSPSDKNDYSHKGRFDHGKGHRPGGDYRDEEDKEDPEKPEKPEDNKDENKPHHHSPADAVIENEKAASCTEDGSYDEVIYCSDETCRAEISRETKLIESKGHNYVDGICDVCKEPDPEYDFKYSEGLEFTLNGDGESYSVTGMGTCTDTVIVIPSTYEGKPVTAIGDSAFFAVDMEKGEFLPFSSTLIGVIIPNSVTAISDNAFSYCKALASVRIPNTVSSIGNNAFLACMSLKTVSIPNGVSSIGVGTFYCCSALTDITLPSSVTSIGSSAFSCCYSLKSINIPGGVTTISDRVFSDCSALESINIPNGVTTIGKCAFQRCYKLVTVTIPDSVTSIGEAAFEECENLTSITIGKNVTSIGSSEIGGSTFIGCYKLAEVINRSLLDITLCAYDFGYLASYAIEVHTGESKVKAVGDYLFYTHDGINYLLNYLGDDAEIVLPESYNGESYVINSAFMGCDTITSVMISDGVKRIGDYSFWRCKNLTNVTISDSVTSIADRAFYQCESLECISVDEDNSYYKSIHGDLYSKDGKVLLQYSIGKQDTFFTVPDGVTTIKTYAFYDAVNITKIVIPTSVTTIENMAFSYRDNITDVYYAGDEAGWSIISIQLNNSSLTNATIHYNYTPEE